MKVCSYCHVTVSESDSVCPRDGQPPVEVQLTRINSALESRFESIEFFGRGSTGDLYLAIDSLTQQHGLLKILRTTSRNYAAERIRLKRELSKQSSFSNHVVPVIAVGETGEEKAAEKLLWLFRQRIEGESLKLCLKREGRLEVSTAIGIAAQMVLGLDMIHRAGLLHRDVKPGHVVLQSDASDLPNVVLVDTGVPARIETKSLFDLVGTPDYISPEQISGKVNSFRSDLYAFGCVFYQMLVGRPPFIGESIEAVFKAHRTEPPPIPDVDLPDPIRSLIVSLLAKEPRERPFSGQQVFRALEPFLPSSPLFENSAISSHFQIPKPVVTNQSTKTVSGVDSPVSVPPPVPPQLRQGISSPPRLTGVKGSVPPPPPPGVRGSRAPHATGSTASVVPTTGLKSGVPPRAVGTPSGAPPPIVPQGPAVVPREDDSVPITAAELSDTAQRVDGETPNEPELLLEEAFEVKVDDTEAERSEDSAEIPEESPETTPPIATEESDASDGNDLTDQSDGTDEESSAPDGNEQTDQSDETELEPIKVPTLETVVSESVGDAVEGQSANAFERIESTGPTHQSGRPLVDFQVDSLFDDEPPQSVSSSSALAQDTDRLSEGSAEVSHDVQVEPESDPEGTAPIPPRRRYDRRVIIGVIGGLVFSVVLLFALSGQESDSDKRVEVKPIPTNSSPASKIDDKKVKAVSTAPPVKTPAENVAKEVPSEENRPAKTATKQEEEEEEPPEDSSESKRSSQSKSRKKQAKASSHAARSDESDLATKLRTEARGHYAARRYKSAATAYRKIIKMKPSDAGAFAGLGASYLALDRAKPAIKAYESAIKLSPKNSGFHAALARAYATVGDRNRAINTYKKALKINPKNRIAKAALIQLTQK